MATSNLLLTHLSICSVFFRIWEKKFGRNANHKIKEEEINKHAHKIGGHTSKITGSRVLGHSAAKGSTHQWKSTRFSQVQHPVDAGWDTRASIPAVATPPGNDQLLHPSWEAKRRLKEKQSIGIVPSQGRKIKFS